MAESNVSGSRARWLDNHDEGHSGLQRVETGNVVVITNRLQYWLSFMALGRRLRTSGMKSTARRWIGWAGYLTGEDNTADPSLRIGDWRGRY